MTNIPLRIAQKLSFFGRIISNYYRQTLALTGIMTTLPILIVDDEKSVRQSL